MSTKSTERAHHVVPLRIYLIIGAALFVLTGLTVWVSFIPLGGWNVAVALGVASIKGTLVALVFMHLLYDKKIFLVVFVGAILFVALFIIFTMFDTLRRDDIYEDTMRPINPNAVIYENRQAPADSAAAHESAEIEPDSRDTESDEGH